MPLLVFAKKISKFSKANYVSQRRKQLVVKMNRWFQESFEKLRKISRFDSVTSMVSRKIKKYSKYSEVSFTLSFVLLGRV